MVIHHQKVQFFCAFFLVYRRQQHTAGVNAHHRSRRQIGNRNQRFPQQFFRLVEGTNTAEDRSLKAESDDELLDSAM